MKLKAILAASLAAFFAMGANAQETEVIEEIIETGTAAKGMALTSDWKSNWFISAGGGAQVLFGDHDRQREFGQRISPALDIAVGKWITPSVGLRLMYSGLYAKGATQNGEFSTGVRISGKPWEGYWLENSKIDFMDLHIDVMFDLCNLIGGYNANRPYSIAFYAGGGYAHTWNTPKKGAHHKEGIVGNVGFFNMFHLGKAWDINLDLRLSAINDGFDGAMGQAPFDGLTTATLGVTYRFAPRGWKVRREIVTIHEYDNDAVNELRTQVTNLVEENEKLEKDVRKGEKVTHNTVEYVGGDYLIYFPINVSELSLADRAQLEQCANSIKAAPKGARFYVIGYADKSTGTAEINEILSRARAESVRKCLVNEFGVNPACLDMEWKGGVDNMFYNDPELSRVVIISPVK